MPGKFELALDIAATHPQSVARYLEDYPVGSVSSFIDAVPDDLSASILKSMLPYHAGMDAETRYQHQPPTALLPTV